VSILLKVQRLIVLVVMLTAAASAAGAQTTDDLFDPGTLNDLRLFMNSRDLQELRDTYLENTYYQADMEWRGIRVRSVGIRSRGHVSRNPTKPGLRIDFNRYVSGQKFLGLSSLMLDNLWQDPSLVRETVTMALFTRLGQPAPRETYVRLFINDVYQGLYGSIESIDSAFLERAFGDRAGYSFEYKWQNEFRGEYLGDSLDPYKARFAPENHSSADDSTLYVPLHDLFLEVNREDSSTWRESVERDLDVPAFLTLAAIETYVSELDGLLGYWGINNVYVYRPSGSSRHQFIPWDRDQSFQAVDSSVMLRVDDNVVMRRLLQQPDLREYYLQVLETLARVTSENAWLDGEIVSRANLIRDAAYADGSKPYSNEEFEAWVGFLREFAAIRPAIVLAEVASLRAAP
jgi:spore coat protein CotH